MDKIKLHPQKVMDVITAYWNSSQESLEGVKKGIEEGNFNLVLDSCVMSKRYLDVISNYARKAFDDLAIVTDDAEYEKPHVEEGGDEK